MPIVPESQHNQIKFNEWINSIISIYCRSAGSECATKSGENKERIREGSFINRSLLALSTLVFNLSRGYRGIREISKLTKVLEPCVGGNSKTLIICCLNPLPDNLNESLVTLDFGKRASGITQNVYENIKRIGASFGDYIKEILKLREENKQLRDIVNKLKELANKTGNPVPFETSIVPQPIPTSEGSLITDILSFCIPDRGDRAKGTPRRSVRSEGYGKEVGYWEPSARAGELQLNLP